MTMASMRPLPKSFGGGGHSSHKCLRCVTSSDHHRKKLLRACRRRQYSMLSTSKYPELILKCRLAHVCTLHLLFEHVKAGMFSRVSDGSPPTARRSRRVLQGLVATNEAQGTFVISFCRFFFFSNKSDFEGDLNVYDGKHNSCCINPAVTNLGSGGHILRLDNDIILTTQLAYLAS